MSDSVLIIGGGVVGAMCAHSLSRDGHAVTIIDRGTFGGACSHGNCGYVCPSHVLPLTVPGVLWKMGPKAFSKKSSLYIKPRMSPSLWAWMARFALNCNHKQMIRAGHALAAMLDSSRALYESVIAEESLACEWETRGLLFVYASKGHFEHFAKTANLIEDEFGRRYERWTEEETHTREPAIKRGTVAGSWYAPGDAHLRPDRLMGELRRALCARGVAVIDGAEFKGFVTEGRQAQAARTSNGDIPADRFVVATGAYSPLVQQHLKTTLPIQPGKGYSITMPRPRLSPTYPIIFEERHVAVTPMASGYRIGSTMEFSGYDTSLNRTRLQALVDGATFHLCEPTAEPRLEEWTGFRPMTPDSLPIIDRAPVAENVWMAVGHNMLGLSMAPATGKLLAEMIGGRTPHIDPTPYALDRF
jgi:D-amino-acid dehydrogenase